MTLSPLIDQFLAHVEIEKNQSQKTVENYKHYLRRFIEFAGDIDPSKITLGLVQSYRLHLNRLADLSKKTQNYHVIALRAFLKYCIRRDVQTLAPEKIELAKIPERTVEFISREEIDKLIEATTGLRDRAILEMLYSTGLRVSELTNLNRREIDLNRREFMVRGKGRKPRLVFLSSRAVEWIASYLQSRTDNWEPLFINTGRMRGKALRSLAGQKEREKGVKLGERRRLTQNSIQRIVRTCALHAGIVKKLTPHALRHAYATHMLVNGADIRSVQELLGHASITTTQIYTHLTNRRLREVHEKFHK